MNLLFGCRVGGKLCLGEYSHNPWTAPSFIGNAEPQNEACSKASGLTPPMWLWRRDCLSRSTTQFQTDLRDP